MRFSERTAWDLGENEWTTLQRSLRGSGRELLDLTVSNPTACGLAPSAEEMLSPLMQRGAARYSPDAFGMRDARDAVAAYYSDHGAAPSMEQICLTTSTSEAYSFLFRLLCDPGDEVLIARPSYPLFDVLAQLDDVSLRSYPLLFDPAATAQEDGWLLDLHALEMAITPRTRAVVVVHPNNPTGNYVGAAERAALLRLCAAHDVALIVDEVFLDYGLGQAGSLDPSRRSFAATEAHDCLCFVLSGLSKVCALPQMKVSWIVGCGPAPLLKEALARLEMIADTFLSVNAPMQYALPQWLAARHARQARIRERVNANLAELDRRVRGSLADRLPVQGGWTVVLRVPAAIEGEEFALAALRRGVVVQPGEFYGLPANRCVLSLLTRREDWARGLALLPV